MGRGKKIKRFRIHKEGYAILFVLLCILVMYNTFIYMQSPKSILFFVGLCISALTFGFFIYFFRNPRREGDIVDPNLIVAPADGRVVVIEPTEEYECFGGKRCIQISIFMSVFSVHTNWYPLAGKVKFVKHHSGRHMGAYLPKSSHENERSTVVIEAQNGKQILMRQIAGALARRIVTYAHEGYRCHLNEHLGFIKFGSRVDLFLPADTEIFVEIGESTVGNETVIARLK